MSSELRVALVAGRRSTAPSPAEFRAPIGEVCQPREIEKRAAFTMLSKPTLQTATHVEGIQYMTCKAVGRVR